MLCRFNAIAIDKRFDFWGGINDASFQNQMPNEFEMQIRHSMPEPPEVKHDYTQFELHNTQLNFDDGVLYGTCSWKLHNFMLS